MSNINKFQLKLNQIQNRIYDDENGTKRLDLETAKKWMDKLSAENLSGHPLATEIKRTTRLIEGFIIRESAKIQGFYIPRQCSQIHDGTQASGVTERRTQLSTTEHITSRMGENANRLKTVSTSETKPNQPLPTAFQLSFTKFISNGNENLNPNESIDSIDLTKEVQETQLTKSKILVQDIISDSQETYYEPGATNQQILVPDVILDSQETYYEPGTSNQQSASNRASQTIIDLTKEASELTLSPVLMSVKKPQKNYTKSKTSQDIFPLEKGQKLDRIVKAKSKQELKKGCSKRQIVKQKAANLKNSDQVAKLDFQPNNDLMKCFTFPFDISQPSCSKPTEALINKNPNQITGETVTETTGEKNKKTINETVPSIDFSSSELTRQQNNSENVIVNESLTWTETQSVTKNPGEKVDRSASAGGFCIPETMTQTDFNINFNNVIINETANTQPPEYFCIPETMMTQNDLNADISDVIVNESVIWSQSNLATNQELNGTVPVRRTELEDMSTEINVNLSQLSLNKELVTDSQIPKPPEIVNKNGNQSNTKSLCDEKQKASNVRNKFNVFEFMDLDEPPTTNLNNFESNSTNQQLPQVEVVQQPQEVNAPISSSNFMETEEFNLSPTQDFPFIIAQTLQCSNIQYDENSPRIYTDLANGNQVDQTTSYDQTSITENVYSQIPFEPIIEHNNHDTSIKNTDKNLENSSIEPTLLNQSVCEESQAPRISLDEYKASLEFNFGKAIGMDNIEEAIDSFYSHLTNCLDSFSMLSVEDADKLSSETENNQLPLDPQKFPTWDEISLLDACSTQYDDILGLTSEESRLTSKVDTTTQTDNQILIAKRSAPQKRSAIEQTINEVVKASAKTRSVKWGKQTSKDSAVGTQDTTHSGDSIVRYDGSEKFKSRQGSSKSNLNLTQPQSSLKNSLECLLTGPIKSKPALNESADLFVDEELVSEEWNGTQLSVSNVKKKPKKSRSLISTALEDTMAICNSQKFRDKLNKKV